MANILTKTGITTGQTIQPFHVTQSVDAFTGLTAYDITISGSLTLTGSVSSLNGFTGNLTGTASRATEAVTATNLNGTAYPSGSVVGAASVFKFIAGAGQTDVSSTAAITVNELAIGGMRVLNQTCFITATAESATGTSIITVDPAGVPPNLQFKSSAPNTKFHFQIMYI
jgi:hypothetical protein